MAYPPTEHPRRSIPPVIRLSLGFVNAYVLRGPERAIVVDTGPPGSARRIMAALARCRVPPETVALILLTHAHFDHSGGAPELHRLLGGRTPIGIHTGDREAVFDPRFPPLRPARLQDLPLFAMVAALYKVRRAAGGIAPFPVELKRHLVPLEEGMSLREYGVEGEVVHTPGHSPGSVSIALACGEMLTGDIISARTLRPREPRWPKFVDHEDLVLPSLRALLGRGPERVHPGHSGPFERESLERFAKGLGVPFGRDPDPI